MCESCSSSGFGRREFLAAAGAIGAVDNICDVYAGPHPILFCCDKGEARRFRAFAKMYRLKLEGNV